MSCHRCSSKFGIFRKEYGCTQCGFGFCGKCCSNKILIPALDAKKKQLVCKSCYEKISSGKFDKETSSSPPLAFKKRLEALGNKPRQPGNESAAECSNEKDQLISTKLDQLKRQRSLGYGVTQTELEERLAKLKGIDPKIYSAPPIMVYREQGSHSTVENAEDLIKQYQEEVKIDSKRLSAEEEIEARLTKLKGREPKTNTETFVPEDLLPPTEEACQLNVAEVEKILIQECEDAEAIAKKEIIDLESNKQLQSEIIRIQNRNEKDEDYQNSDDDDDEDYRTNDVEDKIVQKFVAEVALDEACAKENIGKKTESSENLESSEEEPADELPWCVICNENAQLRCIECEKDLFCLRCFRECHETFDMTNHKTILYKPPPKQLI